MTITVRQTIRTSPVQGGVPIVGEPAGFYAERGVVVGDASGGTMNIAFDYSAPNSQLSGRMFSLEQVDLVSIMATTRGVRVSLLNFNIVNNIIHNWGMQISMSDPTLIGQPVPGATQKLHALGVFLGQQDVAPSSCTMNFSITNFLNDQLLVTIAGYWWDPQSKRAPGGLRRGVGPFPI